MKLFTNKFTTKLSKLFALALITILTLGTNSAFADSNIKDGRYTLTNDTKYLDNNEIGDSMSRSYTDKNMTLEKKDGKIYYTVGFSGAQYMENHRIYVNGSSVSIQKVAENTSAGTLKLKFKVNKPSDTILIKFYVDPMGRDVEYKLIPNLNSLSLVESYEEAKTDSKKEESTSTSSSSNKTENKSESTSSTKTETKVESTTTSTEKEETKDEEKVDTTTEEKKEVETKEETEAVSTEKEETENVETSVKESSQNNTTNIVIICVIVILAAIIGFVLFKRKK